MVWVALQAPVHPQIIKIQPCLWVGLFSSFLSALALVPKLYLKMLVTDMWGLSNFSQLAGVGFFSNCLPLRSDLGMDMGTL